MRTPGPGGRAPAPGKHYSPALEPGVYTAGPGGPSTLFTAQKSCQTLPVSRWQQLGTCPPCTHLPENFCLAISSRGNEPKQSPL